MASSILTHRLARRADIDPLKALMDAAKSEGFKRVELMSTLTGEPLYRACGYESGERLMDDRGGVAVPLLRGRSRR